MDASRSRRRRQLQINGPSDTRRPFEDVVAAAPHRPLGAAAKPEIGASANRPQRGLTEASESADTRHSAGSPLPRPVATVPLRRDGSPAATQPSTFDVHHASSDALPSSLIPHPSSPTPHPSPLGTDRSPTPLWHAVSRGAALFVAWLCLLALVDQWRGAGESADLRWVDLRPCPPAVARGGVALAGVLLTAFAAGAVLPRAAGRLAALLVGMLLIAALVMVGRHYGVAQEQAAGDRSIPHALQVAVCLVLVLSGMAVAAQRIERSGRHAAVMLLAFAICLVGYPLVATWGQAPSRPTTAAAADASSSSTAIRGAVDKAVTRRSGASPGARVSSALSLLRDAGDFWRRSMRGDHAE